MRASRFILEAWFSGNVAGYYEPLRQMLERAASDGFLRPEHLRLVEWATTPAELLDRLANFQPLALHQVDRAG